MSDLREALEKLCDRYDRIVEQLSIRSGVKASYDIPGSEIRSLLAAHPAEPAPVARVAEALAEVMETVESLCRRGYMNADAVASIQRTADRAGGSRG